MFFIMMILSYPVFNLGHVGNQLKWLFLVFPHYALSDSFNKINEINSMDRICRKQCEQLFDCNVLCAATNTCCRK